ncbi:MAG: PBP1A family penicillin-binding protein [Rickettsiales bacterium]|jgi:penicillin-binding protein 1A|nr:PBP1A family penicillin-binding protein [Rickettsiales bacterium]
MTKTQKHIVKFFVISALLSVLSIMLILLIFVRELPDYQKLVDYKPVQMSRLYSADGYLIDEYAKEKRLYIPIASIPDNVKAAFLSAEDSNFYNHYGVDPKPILRAIYQNIFRVSQGRNIIGASTITQQVVKNILLTQERTFSRKIKEAILAVKISGVLSKDKILELYLNEIYLGYRSYGVAAAAINYFGKSLNQLTLEEAAFLAILPKAPTSLDPRKNYSKALIRRNWVLSRMLEDGAIDQKQYENSITLPIFLADSVEQNTVHAGAYSEEIRKRSEELLGDDKIFTDGLFVLGTLDANYQNSARESLQWGLHRYDRRRGYRGPVKQLDLSIPTEKKKQDLAEENNQINNLLDSLDEEVLEFDAIREDWPELLAEIPQLNKMKWQDWELALVLDTGENSEEYSAESSDIEAPILDSKVQIGFADNSIGYINLKDLAWARKVIRAEDLENGGYKDQWSDEITHAKQVFTKGDVIIVEKKKRSKNNYLLRQIPKVNGAIVVMNVHDGRVLAMVGGYNDDKTEFNRATQAYRQPGSIVKPFTYLAALEKGFMPNMIIVDDEVRMKKEDGTSWIPKNYSGKFYGPTTMRLGLEKSRNVVTVRLAQIVGLERIANLMENLNIVDEAEQNYSMILGSSESNLLRITTGYAMIANGGRKIKPHFIEKIHDNQGKIIYKRDNMECVNCNFDPYIADIDIALPEFAQEKEQIIDERSAYQTISLLEGVVQRGTGWRAKSLNKPLGGKTGTTNESFDAWFVGFSSDIVVGVWVGYDTPISLGQHETGSSVAVPIFISAMSKILNDENAQAFRIPANIKFAKIDRFSGQKPSQQTLQKDIIFESFKSENYLNFQNNQQNNFNIESQENLDSKTDSENNNYETNIY